jgi:hypothetical protein
LHATNVLTMQAYIDEIKTCITPSPDVVQVDRVMDVKSLFNPGQEKTLPATVSRCHRALGLGTKTLAVGRQWFMSETSALHWRMRLDANGKVITQTKFTVDDDNWSVAHYPWTPTAPRPNDRVIEENMSGLLWSDVKMAATRPLSDTRLKELLLTTRAIGHRLNSAQRTEMESVLDRLQNPSPVGELPCDHGRFIPDGEDYEPDEEKEEDAAPLQLRSQAVYPSQAASNHYRELRKRQGHASTALEVDQWVAYPVKYLDSYPAAKKQRFWVGKITQLDATKGQVCIDQWHTAQIDNLKGTTNPTYKRWAGKDSGLVWIPVKDVLEQFKLTKNNRINERCRRAIGRALVLAASNAASGVCPAGVGRDAAENPD